MHIHRYFKGQKCMKTVLKSSQFKLSQVTNEHVRYKGQGVCVCVCVCVCVLR